MKFGDLRETRVVSRLKQEDLDARLAELDEALSARGLPLKFRPLEAFKDLYGTIPDGPERMSLFDPISCWFITRYGQNAHWDGVIGKIPILLRGAVYLVLVPFTVDDAVARLVDHIEGLPEDVATTFTPEEFETLGRQIAGGTISLRTVKGGVKGNRRGGAKGDHSSLSTAGLVIPYIRLGVNRRAGATAGGVE